MNIPGRSVAVDWRRALGMAVAAWLATPAALAQAQDEPTSREVVQPLPPAGGAELNAALKRLSANPRDVEALLQAGTASLKLQEIDAAIGFFARAEALGTANGPAKAGLAAAQVYKKKPVEALHLFAEAEAEGVSIADYAGDYGLANDLVGDNARAQEYYRLALERGEDQEITRRLALSQAIGGDQLASEATLLPLLQHRDLAAYRARAFALAALGKTEEAVAIAEAVMPASLASRISPYLRYMPKLTRAQQAAAANFGHFPDAASIGHDDPRIAEYTSTAQPSATPAPASDDRLVPSGVPLGPATRPAPPPQGPIIGVTAKDQASPPVDASQEPAPAERQISVPSISIAGAAAGEHPARPESEVFDLGSVNSGRSGPISPSDIAPGIAGEMRERAGSPGAVATGPESLANAFAGFDAPETSVEPAPGAVDVTAIEPPRDVEKKQPPKPVNPSRIWVQVATGRDRSALGFDWHRFTRKAEAAFKGRSGYLARWGRTNRLLTGPFESQREALDFVTRLKAAGIDSFTFISKAGEDIAPLPRR